MGSPVLRKIPLWKLVGGAAVHAVAPLYLLALGVDGWRFAAGGQGDLAAWLAHVPGLSAWFFALYAAGGAGATGLAALLAPAGPAPELHQDHLSAALAQGRGRFGPQADAALERIAALRPGGEAPGGEADAMLRDLAAMVAAGRAALNGQDDAQIRAMTAQAIERIADELAEQARARTAEAQDKARIMATYVGQRYGQDEL